MSTVNMIVMCYVCFFNDTATTEIYTLSLHDALPIFSHANIVSIFDRGESEDGTYYIAMEYLPGGTLKDRIMSRGADRKSTRLNSSHANISYAVFCLKKKKKHFVLYTR